MNNKRKYFNVITNSATKTAEIFIYGVIGSWYEDTRAKDFARQFRQLESEHDRINIRLNSPGGVVDEGKAIVNLINQSKKEIHTYCDGIVYSMACPIFLAVPVENRHIARNGMAMIHNAATIEWGNAQQLRETADVLDKYDDTLIADIAYATGKTEEDVKNNWFDYKDHFFTAKDCKENGIVATIEEYDAENVPEDINNMTHEQIVSFYQTKNEEDKTSFIDQIAEKVTAVFTAKNKRNTIPMNLENLLNLVEGDSPINLSDEDKSVLKTEINAALGKGVFNQQELDAKIKTATDPLNKTIGEKETEIDNLNTQITDLKNESKSDPTNPPKPEGDAGAGEEDDIQAQIDALPHNVDFDEVD